MILQTQSLTKRFGDFTALNNVSISIPKGSIYGFLGPNGAGKTTTIRALMGIISLDTGEINIFGKTVSRIDDSIKMRIGYVSQEQFFYEWMSCKQIGEFVSGFYPTWSFEEYYSLLEKFDIPLKKKISTLSIGMKLKLALALALSHKPELLILDEPTSGLDPLSRREFLDIIESQARDHQRTTFFSSHIIDEVEKIADVIGIIEKGELLYEGKLVDLKQNTKCIRVYSEDAEERQLPELFSQSDVLKTYVKPECTEYFIYSSDIDWSTVETNQFEVNEVSLEDTFIAFTKSKVVL